MSRLEGWLLALRLAAGLLFAVLWVVVGVGDVREQRVRHRYIRLGAAAVAFGYLLLLSNTVLGVLGHSSRFHYWGFYSAAGEHMALAAGAALLLWALRVWPAGDAKLFILLSAWYPLFDMTGDFFADRLFVITLINIFIPACLGVLARAGVYFLDTRVLAYRGFFGQLGWTGETKLLKGWAAEKWGAFRTALAERSARLRAQDWRGRLNTAWSGVVWAAPQTIQWFSGMALMALVSYYVHDFLTSPLLLSLLCFAGFMLWSQASEALGRDAARALGVILLGALLWQKPPRDWGLVISLFRSVTVFSFFLFLGTQWAMGFMREGGWGMVVSFALPLVLTTAVFAVVRAVNLVWRLGVDSVRVGAPALASASAAARAARPALEARAAGLQLWWLNQPMPFAGRGSSVAFFLKLAAMGAFFGLALVVVRVWDEEVRPSQSADTLGANAMLSPGFLDKLREDDEFFAAHFSSVYADGLTADQAGALRDWCRGRGIEKVPLAPTMSFASWIFLGFALSWLLRADVVRMML